MPIGTSDGQYHEDEFQAAVAAPAFADDRAPLDQVTFNPMRKNWEQPGSDWVDEGSSFANQAPSFVYDKIVAPTASKVYNAVVTKPLAAIKDFTESAMQMPLGASVEDHPEVASKGAEVAFDLLGLGMASAPYKQGLGLFGGRLSQDALRLAGKMETAGIDERLIKKMTGLERGSEGRWKNEISDHQAKFNPEKLEDYKAPKEFGKIRAGYLGDVLDHEKLFKVYPELKDVLVVETPIMEKKGFYGMFDSNVNTIYINPKIVNDPEKIKSTMLHEIQHWIQFKEGFTIGTPNEIEAVLKDNLKSAIIKRNYQGNFNEIKRLSQEYKSAKGPTERQTIYEEAVKIAKSTLEDAEHPLYSSIAGEVEARNASRRAGMTDTQRLLSLGKDTEDIQRGSQIIHDQKTKKSELGSRY